MTKETIEYVKTNFVVDIIRNDNGYVHAYVHNKNGDYNCSFNIQTSPEMLFYYGDLGTFVFKRHGQDNMLRFFNRKEPDFFYWEEKCVAGEVKQYDPDTACRSFLKIVASNFDIEYDDNTPDEDIVKEINEIDDDFEFVYNDESWEYGERFAIDYFSEHSICYEDFSPQKYTRYFERCLWNLALFSGKILELVEDKGE